MVDNIELKVLSMLVRKPRSYSFGISKMMEI